METVETTGTISLFIVTSETKHVIDRTSKNREKKRKKTAIRSSEWHKHCKHRLYDHSCIQ